MRWTAKAIGVLAVVMAAVACGSSSSTAPATTTASTTTVRPSTTSTAPPFTVPTTDEAAAFIASHPTWSVTLQPVDVQNIVRNACRQLTSNPALYAGRSYDQVVQAVAVPITPDMLGLGQLIDTYCPIPNGTSPEGAVPLPVTISMGEFEQLSDGMSYDDVVAIIGGAGELSAQTGSYSTYTWDGITDGSNAVVTFENGLLVSKAQAGL